MKRAWKQKSIQAVSCLFCLIMWRYGPKLDGTEFSGGWLTGPLLTLYNSGTLLYGTALLLTFIFRRISAAITIVASLLCLLLYAYFVAPGHFRWVFRRAEFEVPSRANFVWNDWAIVGILALAIAAYVSFRSLMVSEVRDSQNPGT